MPPTGGLVERRPVARWRVYALRRRSAPHAAKRHPLSQPPSRAASEDPDRRGASRRLYGRLQVLESSQHLCVRHLGRRYTQQALPHRRVVGRRCCSRRHLHKDAHRTGTALRVAGAAAPRGRSRRCGRKDCANRCSPCPGRLLPRVLADPVNTRPAIVLFAEGFDRTAAVMQYPASGCTVAGCPQPVLLDSHRHRRQRPLERARHLTLRVGPTVVDMFGAAPWFQRHGQEWGIHRKAPEAVAQGHPPSLRAAAALRRRSASGCFERLPAVPIVFAEFLRIAIPAPDIQSSRPNTSARSTRARSRAQSKKVPANLRCRKSRSGGGVRA
jgi:hypothetical protein